MLQNILSGTIICRIFIRTQQNDAFQQARCWSVIKSKKIIRNGNIHSIIFNCSILQFKKKSNSFCVKFKFICHDRPSISLENPKKKLYREMIKKGKSIQQKTTQTATKRYLIRSYVCKSIQLEWKRELKIFMRFISVLLLQFFKLEICSKTHCVSADELFY